MRKAQVKIMLSATPTQCASLDAAAARFGKSRSDFILDAACEQAATVLADQVHFELSDDAYQQFVTLLDTPPAQNTRLDWLLRRKPLWEA